MSTKNPINYAWILLRFWNNKKLYRLHFHVYIKFPPSNSIALGGYLFLMTISTIHAIKTHEGDCSFLYNIINSLYVETVVEKRVTHWGENTYMYMFPMKLIVIQDAEIIIIEDFFSKRVPQGYHIHLVKMWWWHIHHFEVGFFRITFNTCRL